MSTVTGSNMSTVTGSNMSTVTGSNMSTVICHKANISGLLAVMLLSLSVFPAWAGDWEELDARSYITALQKDRMTWLCEAEMDMDGDGDMDMDGDGDMDILYSISDMHAYDYTEEKYGYLKWMVFFNENDKFYFSRKNSIFSLRTRQLEIVSTDEAGDSPVFVDHGYYPEIKNRVWGAWFEKRAGEVVRKEETLDVLDLKPRKNNELAGHKTGGANIEDILSGYRCLDKDGISKIYGEKSVSSEAGVEAMPENSSLPADGLSKKPSR